MVVREPSTGRYLPFGNLKTTAKGEYATSTPCFQSSSFSLLSLPFSDHLEKDYFKRKNGPTVCCEFVAMISDSLHFV